MKKGPSKYEFEGPYSQSLVLASGFPAPRRCALRFGLPTVSSGTDVLVDSSTRSVRPTR